MKTETYLGYIATTAQFECSYFSIHLHSRPDSAKMKFQVSVAVGTTPLYPLVSMQIVCISDSIDCTVSEIWKPHEACAKKDPTYLAKYLLPWHLLLTNEPPSTLTQP